MNEKIHLFKDKQMLARALAREFLQSLDAAPGRGKIFHIALSGGSTPRALFKHLAGPPYQTSVPWERLCLFWGDERCVPPEHEESNYRMTRETLLDHITIPAANIQRIRGEDAPYTEATRYAGMIQRTVPSAPNGLPQFDWIFLGLGADGHTASLFPGAPGPPVGEVICLVAEHPQTGQKRISLTLPVINTAKRITFLVTGSEKRAVLEQILKRKQGYQHYPAAAVSPAYGMLEWYLDQEATCLMLAKSWRI